MSTFGPSYDQAQDGQRLKLQHEDIRDFCMDGEWRTLHEISGSLGYPEASVSAQLRHLRKEKFGAHIVEKRRRGGRGGTYEYRVLPPKPREAVQIPLLTETPPLGIIRNA